MVLFPSEERPTLKGKSLLLAVCKPFPFSANPFLGRLYESTCRAIVVAMVFVKDFIYPSLAEHNMPCLSKQCRSRSVGF